MELRTVRIEITNSLAEESKERLKETMLQCQRVFEFFAKLGCKHKSVSYMNLHKFGYAEIIAEFPDLPTTYIQSTAKQALACLDAYNKFMEDSKDYNIEVLLCAYSKVEYEEALVELKEKEYVKR